MVRKRYDGKRIEAYKTGSLPYSFSYKIIKKFVGKECPICHKRMGVAVYSEPVWTKTPRPTVQHNKPISLGGKHEIENISIICRSCNSSLRNTETGSLNNEEVKKAWTEILNGV